MENTMMGVAIARQIQSTEKAVDAAMMETSSLVRVMLEGRLEAKLAAEVGHAELSDVVAGLGQLAQARGLVVQSHRGLAVIADDLGYRWKMAGPLERKLEPTGRLSVVDAA